MNSTRTEMLRFGAAGVAGLAADVLVLYAALALGAGPYGGRVLSFLAAVWVTWRINRRYTFADGGGLTPWRQWWRYLGAMLGGGAVNYAAYSAVIAFGPAGPLLPMAAVMCGSLAGMTVNFIGAKFFVFKA